MGLTLGRVLPQKSGANRYVSVDLHWRVLSHVLGSTRPGTARIRHRRLARPAGARARHGRGRVTDPAIMTTDAGSAIALSRDVSTLCPPPVSDCPEDMVIEVATGLGAHPLIRRAPGTTILDTFPRQPVDQQLIFGIPNAWGVSPGMISRLWPVPSVSQTVRRHAP